MTVKQAATLLHLDERTVRNYVNGDRLPGRKLPGGAAVVLNASGTSTKGSPAFSVYSATKAAVRSFARSWSVDLKERKIRVNAISPGMVVTPAFSNALGMNDAQIDQFTAQAAGRTPLGRSGTPDEIAKAVVFLASDDSSFITGVLYKCR